MDEFQFQLYLGKINSLAGTKKPLRDLAIEIDNISSKYTNTYEYHQFLYKKQILLRKIIELSTAVNPIPKQCLLDLNNNLSRLVTSNHINVEQTKTLIKYRPNAYYCFMPDSLSELVLIDTKVQLFSSTSWMLSVRSLPLTGPSTLIESIVYLYISAIMPNSILLSSLKYKPSDKLSTYINELTTHFNIIQSQLTKEQHEHTN